MRSMNLPKLLVLAAAFFFSLTALKAQVAETEPNNTPAQANAMPLNGSGTGVINPAGDVDWWKVKTNADGLLSVTLTPLSGRNTYVYLYDTAGTIQFTGTYSTSAFTISQDGLAAGTYYMEVYCYFGTDTSSYIISNSLTPAPVPNDKEPDSTRATALTLALDGSTTGHIGYYYNNHRDTVDEYKVTTNADGLLRLSLNPINGTNVFVTLYDNDGTTVLQSSYSSAPFTISQDGLAVGTYYAAVYCYYNGQFAPYVISDSLFPTPIPNDKEPDSSRATALTLPLNDSTQGHIGYYYNRYRDTVDEYKITTNADGLLRLSLNPINGTNVFVTLYDNDGTTVLESQYGSSTFSFSYDGLAAGTYYVQVYCYYNYQFAPYILYDSLFTTGVGNDKEPNGTVAQADTLPLDATVSGHIGYYYNHVRDTVDWYKLTTNADGLIRLSLNQLNNTPVYVTLYDHDGTTVLNSQYGYSSFSVSTDGLAAGTYYVAVYCYYNSQFSPYVLSDSLFTYNKNDVEPNAYFREAATVPANRTVTGHIGFYYNGVRDTVDTWKINYTGTSGNLNLTFNLLNLLSSGSTNPTFFQVYSDTTAAPLYSNYLYGVTPVNLTGLAQGYYFIKVYEYYSSQFNAYSITDSFTQVNIAQISLVNAGITNTCSSDTLTYSLSGSHSPYTVRLYRDGALYDSVITSNSTVSFTGLSDGNYFATVYGDGATDSAYSKSVVTQFLPPYPVGLYTNGIGVHTATLNWTKYDCAKRYAVEYRATGSNTWITSSTLTDTSTYALSGLAPYTLYSWRIATIDSVGSVLFMSAYSDSVTFRTLSDTAHIALIHSGIGASCDGDTLEYSATHSEAPYTVQLYRNGAAYRSAVSVTDTALFTGLPSGNYYATATGTGSGGSLGTSDTTQLTPPVPTGLSPYDSTVTTATTASVYWNALTCAESFDIQYMLKGSGTWVTVNTAGDSSSFTLTGLTADTLYYWRIASVDSIGIMSAYSYTDSFMTLSSLPVTLLYFNGAAVGNTSQLNWKTAAELNNKEFVVERSADGINFTVIGQVVGAGTTSLPNTYEFTDAKPLPGTNFYRLQQVDDNGHFVYSKTVTVNFGSSASFVLYPNPATSIVNIVVPQSSSSLMIIITDLQGRTVMQKQLNVNSTSLQLDVSNLAAGVYNVTLMQGSLKQNQKLIKE